MLLLIQWLESNLAPCLYQKYLGIACPGCGLQRSFIALLKGDIAESFQLYPALIPMLFMFAYLVLHLVFKFKNGAQLLKYAFMLCAGTVVVNYIYKLMY